MTKLRTKLVIILPIVAVVLATALTAWYLRDQAIPVLQPAGEVGHKERQLLILGALLSVLVVVPVFVMATVIAWKYREDNPKSTKYNPDWDSSRLFESIWWGIPIIIIGFLSVVTWHSAHALDPYKPLASDAKPLTVQVVAMDWKWLFIYPEQHIASVNMMQFPVDRPLELEVTSDTVMNSFWVPALGGQIYAMPGMITKLHLVADKPGDFYGSPANISGSGFAGMTFTARASSSADFDRWVQSAQRSDRNLTTRAYAQLAKPSKNNPVEYYSPVQDDLYKNLVMKYMMPMQKEQPKSATPMHHMPGMEMDGTM